MKNFEIIHNAATGEITEIDIDDVEMKRREVEASKKEDQKQTLEARRETALAKLAALGLTTDDLSALGL